MCVSPKKNSRKIFMFCTKTTHETNHCKTVRLESNVRFLRTTAPSFVEYTTYTRTHTPQNSVFWWLVHPLCASGKPQHMHETADRHI